MVKQALPQRVDFAATFLPLNLRSGCAMVGRPCSSRHPVGWHPKQYFRDMGSAIVCSEVAADSGYRSRLGSLGGAAGGPWPRRWIPRHQRAAAGAAPPACRTKSSLRAAQGPQATSFEQR